MDDKTAQVAVQKARAGGRLPSKRTQADELLTPKQVHADYGFNPQTLSNWRWQGIGPDYIKTSPSRAGRVKYRRSAIEQWLDSQTVSNGGSAA